MARISERHIKAWQKFNDELEAFKADTGVGGYVTLYEDAYTTREVKDFKITKTGILTWWEAETYKETERQEREQVVDEDDAREWLKFWRAAFRRAKRYWAMDAETLDKIQEGQIEDMED